MPDRGPPARLMSFDDGADMSMSGPGGPRPARTGSDAPVECIFWPTSVQRSIPTRQRESHDIAESLAESSRLPRYPRNEIWRTVPCGLPSLELARLPMETPPCCAATGTTSPCGPPPVGAPRHSPPVRRWWRPASSRAAFIRALPQAVPTRCRVQRLWWWRCRDTDIATCSTPQRRFCAASRSWCSAPICRWRRSIWRDCCASGA